MNVRVLELLQRPENISAEDISVLQNEISKFPYMQSVRTLYLSAIHQFDTDNYQKELTKTAAYTTDKKILYHFINNKKEVEKREAAKLKKINLVKEQELELSNSIINEPIEQTIEKISIENENLIVGDTELETPISNIADTNFDEIPSEIAAKIEVPVAELEQIDETKPVVTHPVSVVGDTELETPIVEKIEEAHHEGNEAFENRIFAELAKEEEQKNDGFKTREGDLNYSKDTVLEHIDKIEETKVKPSEISFNAFESFLPDVKFSVPSKNSEPQKEEIIEKAVSEPEIEKQEEISEPEVINFHQTQEFEIKEEHISDVEEIVEENIVSEEVIEEAEIEPEVHFEWKPMNFVQSPLDAHINIPKVETPKKSIAPIIEKTIEPEAKPVEILPIEELKIEKNLEEIKTEIEDEKPFMNISFLNNDVAELTAEEPIVEEQNSAEIIEKVAQDTSSNIPNFVNTWQNWLKIDRKETEVPEETEPVKIIEKKAEIIDKFIEDNPKISQLREDGNFVVKEKASDISHLMTETLANLYVEQRLYTKAIIAFESLQKKHPERQEEFENRIQEIKDLRHNK